MPVRSLLVTALTAVAGLGCQVPDENHLTVVQAPDYDQFKGVAVDGALQPAGVSRLLERRCATLDCHGQVSRPMRIYGQYGLRLVEDGSLRPGIEPTTEDEYQANYESVIGLQPEMMSLVVEGVNAPEALMLVRKPLQVERHKGGAVFETGDDAYQCITTWLKGHADFGACSRSLQ